MRRFSSYIILSLSIWVLSGADVITAQEAENQGSSAVLQATYQENQALLADADAVILSRSTEIEITDPRSRDTVEEVWMKILSGNGKNIYGDLKILFDERFDTVTLLAAETQTADGRLLPLMDGADNEIIPPWLMDAAVYGAIKQRVISFSGVEPGAVIHYKVRIETRYPADERWISGTHFFQEDIPVLREDFVIRVLESKALKLAVSGGLAAPHVKKGRYAEYSWERDDTPMVQLEWGSVPMQNVVPRLIYSCAPDWKTVSDWFRSRFQKAQDVPFTHTELLAKMTAGCVTDTEKAAAIYHWVCTNIRTIDLPMSLAGYDPNPPDTTLERRFGDMRDKSVLLAVLLKAAGFSTDWILFNREPDWVEASVPAIDQFDAVGCIVELPAKRMFWLDPGPNNLPFGCFLASMGRKGLKIGKKQFELISVPVLPPEYSQSKTDITISFTDDDRVSGEINWKGQGYFEYLARDSNRELTPEERKRAYSSSVTNAIPGASITGISESNWDDLTEPPWIKITFTATHLAPREGDIRVIEIPSVPLAFSRLNVNSTTPSRVYPLRVESTAREVIAVNLTLPEGSRILYAPETMDQRSKGITWQMKAQQTSGGYKSETIRRWSAVDFPTDAYQDIRQIMDISHRLDRKLILLAP